MRSTFRAFLAVGTAGLAVAASLVGLTAPAKAANPSPAVALTLTPSRVIGSGGHAGLYGWGATTLLNGDILIGDYWNFRVLRFGADGTYKGIWLANRGFASNQHQAPYGLATDPTTGDVYMADTDRYKIDKYDPNGNFLLTFGSQGTGPNKFLYPSRVAVSSDGTVFVVDTWANVIDVYDSNGTYLRQFGGTGSAPGQFLQPHGAAFDSQDRLWVNDTKNYRVQVFSTAGTPLFQFGSKGAMNGQFEGDLRGLAIDKTNGWVYVVDGEGNRVDKFDLTGKFLLRWGTEGTGLGQFHDGGREATVGQDGTVWVGDMPSYRVDKFSPTGVALGSYPDPAAPPPPGGFNQPRGAAVDSNGNIFVSDTYNFRVQKLDSSGNYVTQWGSRGRDLYEFNYSRLIATDPTDGSVLLADTDNHRIKKYDNNGLFLWQTGGLGKKPGQFKNPHAVAVGATGTVWVTDTNNQRIQSLNGSNGAPLTQFGSKGTGNGQFMFPRGIAVDPVDGTLWVADSGRDDIQHFTTTGTYLGKVGSKGTTDTTLQGPFGVAVDANYVYVADTSAHKVKAWGKDGTFAGAFGGRGTKVGQLIGPQGLYIHGNGLYVTDTGNDRIQIWTIGGTAAVDTTLPTAVLTTPTAGGSALSGTTWMKGTAADDNGVAFVELAIQNVSTQQWWDPAIEGWGAAKKYSRAQVLGSDVHSVTWQFPLVGTLPGTQYTYSARAIDLNNNVGKVTKPITFTALPEDTVNPTTVLSTPTAGSALTSSPVSVTGTASDDIGVASVAVQIQDTVSGNYWSAVSGAFTGQVATSAATVSSPGSASTPWSFSFDAAAAAAAGGSGQYTVTPIASDTSGNVDGVPPSAAFTVTLS